MKKWRHSYTADWDVYQIENEAPIQLGQIIEAQYFSFSKNSDRWAYVMNNDIFVSDRSSGHFGIQATSTGEKEKIFNGIPDWVYEEEVVGTN